MIEKFLPQMQFGFRPMRSTTSAIYTLKHMVKRRLEDRKKTFALFIDYKRAFASVDRQKLFMLLIKRGVSENFIKLIGFIYENSEIFIKGENGTTRESFFTNIGLPEGSCLSPLLFAAFIFDLEDYAGGEGIKKEDVMGIPDWYGLLPMRMTW